MKLPAWLFEEKMNLNFRLLSIMFCIINIGAIITNIFKHQKTRDSLY